MKKATARTAAEVCRRFELDEKARPLLSDDLAPRPFLDALAEKGFHTDAVRFLAHALPKPETIWWACLCAREAAGSEASPSVKVALAAIEKWLGDPSDGNRRAAMTAAQACGFGTPAGSAALAVFLSGGSLAPPDVGAVPPAENLTAVAAGGAVILAAVSREPEKATERYRSFLARGVAVGDGQDRWPARR